jgi:hypothetical protein
MKLDLRRECIVIIPESDQDVAFIEDSLGLKKNGDMIACQRVNEVAMGFVKNDLFVLRTTDRIHAVEEETKPTEEKKE